jgi:hypothetical protein
LSAVTQGVFRVPTVSPTAIVNLRLAGLEMAMDYDDTTELTRYVWDNYQSLMTDFERRVGAAIIARIKSGAATSPAMAQILSERWGKVGDPEIEDALASGAEDFRQRVCQRVLTECASEVFINRCTKCGRIVRTPQAQQCFWCGHDWHQIEV